MKNLIKLISLLLAVFMIMSAFSALTIIGVSADDSDSGSDDSDSSADAAASDEEDPYLTTIYATADEKLATMELLAEKDGVQLYVDDYSGEVACVNTITGEKLFTNPYDIGASTGNSTTKQEIMSQIILDFSLVTRPGEKQVFTSYEEAVKRNQINVEKIKDGVRVEYTLGREQSKSLVPKLITKERFDEIFLTKFMEAFPNGELYADPKNATPEAKEVQKFLTRYVLYSMDEVDMSTQDRNLFGYVSDNLNKSDRDRARVIKDYPVVAKIPVYVFDPKASEVEIEECEKIIEQYCPEYTYEELEWDHSLTDYESDDQNPPVFRLALEYKINNGALDVRLPANGIRFNEALYTLNGIEVLPYMGAGNSSYDGFNFFPDGSGALFDFAQLNTSVSRTVKADVYGVDYAYHDITGRYQKPIRYPVFGIVENTVNYKYEKYDDEMNNVIAENIISGAIVDAVKAYRKGETINTCKGNEQALCDFIVYEEKAEGAAAGTPISCVSVITDKNTIETEIMDQRGFVAIIEEGDALASLTTYHAGSLSDYNTVKMSILPRPKDAYVLSDSISVSGSGDSKVHITCERKYTDSYRLKYILLTDTDNKDLAMPEGMVRDTYNTYDTSWMGMAVAYRDYLYAKGILDKLKPEEIVESNIPLYIETFGTVEATKKILSVPVTVKESLTTFEDVADMYEYLSGQGIKNINFKLTGYANGGMEYTVPGNLKFERVVGGNKGFQALLDKAAEINKDKTQNMGIFPDFDLVYQLEDGMFDSYRQFDHAAKTIDDRYATRREYDVTKQKQENYYDIIISPAYFYIIYNGLEKNYAGKYDNIVGISVSSLGSWLNSDFDEDEPYNREDSKQFTIEAFEHFEETYGQVMTEGGNAYVWKYSDHILSVPLDSSRYIFSSAAVPFVGVVLHGSVNFAGEPLNMEGDMQYAILKAIENGASPYFILCMDNTEILKEHDDLSKYYSVRYDIWKDDIADVYNTLNGVLADVQDKYIIGHQSITGLRVPDADELESDIYLDFLKDIQNEENASQIIELEAKLQASTARTNGKNAELYAQSALDEMYDKFESYIEIVNESVKFDDTYYANMKAAALIEYLNMASAVAKYADDYYNDADYATSKKITDAVKRLNVDPMVLYAGLASAKVGAAYEDDYNAVTDAYTALYDSVLAIKDAKVALEAAQKAQDDAQKAVDEAQDDDARAAANTALEECKNATEAARTELAKCEADKQNAIDKIAEIEADAELQARVELHCKWLAAIAAIDLLKAGKNSDFNAVLPAFTAKYLAERYSSFANMNSEENGDTFKDNDTYAAYYTAYITAKAGTDALENVIAVPENERLVEDYVAYVAKTAAFEELGLHKVENSILRNIYENNSNNAKTSSDAYSSAKNVVAKLVYTDYKGIVECYEEMLKHQELVIEAVAILAAAEDVTLEYTEGKEGDVRFITNYDAIESSIVKQAIDRALFVIQCMEVTTYAVAKVETGAEAGYFSGEKVATLEDGTEIFYDVDDNKFYSVAASAEEEGKFDFTVYDQHKAFKEYYEYVTATAPVLQEKAYAMVKVFSDSFYDDVQKKIEINNRDFADVEEEEEEVSKYVTGNIVVVTYGADMNTPYKSIILNYNNYAVNVEYNGKEYTIPAHEFAEVK